MTYRSCCRWGFAADHFLAQFTLCFIFTYLLVILPNFRHFDAYTCYRSCVMVNGKQFFSYIEKIPTPFCTTLEGKIDSLNVNNSFNWCIWTPDTQYSIDPLNTGVYLESFWKIETPMTIITQYFEVKFFISIKDVISSIELWRQVGIWTGNVAAYQNHKFKNKKYFSKIQGKKSRILEKYLQKFSRIENPKKSRILEISRSRNLERETLTMIK